VQQGGGVSLLISFLFQFQQSVRPLAQLMPSLQVGVYVKELTPRPYLSPLANGLARKQPAALVQQRGGGSDLDGAQSLFSELSVALAQHVADSDARRGRKRERGGGHLDGAQLFPELPVALVQHVADGREPRLLQEHHEQQELRGHDGQREVEVEDLAGFGVRRQGGHQVGDGSDGGGLRQAWGLHLPARRVVVRNGAHEL